MHLTIPITAFAASSILTATTPISNNTLPATDIVYLDPIALPALNISKRDEADDPQCEIARLDHGDIFPTRLAYVLSRCRTIFEIQFDCQYYDLDGAYKIVKVQVEC